MRSEKQWLLGRNLLTSLSIALGYPLTGQWKMVELVTRNFWWPGVTKEVKRYVEGCNACQ